MTALSQTIRPSTAQSREWKAIVVLILLIPVLWSPPFLFRFFLYQPFNIPSGSMAPTLMVGDYVFAAKYAYGYGRYSFPFAPSWISGRVLAAEPEHGDIVVFRTAKNSSLDYVKRVVGLPGDRVQMRQGQLFLNDKPVTRVALKDASAGAACGGDNGVRVKRWRETLPNGASYVMYDCVDNSFLDNTAVFTVPSGHFARRQPRQFLRQPHVGDGIHPDGQSRRQGDANLLVARRRRRAAPGAAGEAAVRG